jgi:hypothetical protein
MKPTDYVFTTDDFIVLEIAKDKFKIIPEGGSLGIQIRSIRLPVVDAMPIFLKLFALWSKLSADMNNPPTAEIVEELIGCHKLFVKNSVVSIYDPATPTQPTNLEEKHREFVEQILTSDYPNYAGWLLHCAQLNFYSFLDTHKQLNLIQLSQKNKMFQFLTSGKERTE